VKVRNERNTGCKETLWECADFCYLNCYSAYINESVFVDCCRWYKFIDGTMRKQAVTLDDRVKQVSGTLIIKEARVEDSGKYLCVVNNSVGGESVETVLTVTGMQHATSKSYLSGTI
jgi:hypothetical protein